MNKWRLERNVEIQTVEELILKYYSSFTVVRIPVKGRYALMDRQVNRLREAIDASCRESFQAKRRARMLSTSDELNVYLQAAFDHFTSNLSAPFNFIEVAWRNNPLPENFGDHILRLATAVYLEFHDQQKTTGQWIFENLSSMVASCIMLDCVQYRKGNEEAQSLQWLISNIR